MIRRRAIITRLVIGLFLGLVTTVTIAWAASLQSGMNLRVPDMTARLRNGWTEGSGWVRAHHAFKPAWRQTYAQATETWTYGTGSGNGGLQPTPKTPEESLTERERRLVMPWVTGARTWPNGIIENFTLNDYGWPWSSLYSRRLLAGGVETWDHHLNLADQRWFASRPIGDPRGLPIGIVFPGFLQCITLWAAAWTTLLLAIPIARSRLRRRRGRCPRCGYDLKGELGAGCSECGWHRLGGDDQTASAQYPSSRPRFGPVVVRVIRSPRRLITCLILGFTLPLGIGALASTTVGIGSPKSFMIIPGRPGGPIEGTVMVSESRRLFRTDLLLDPGPYSASQRRTIGSALLGTPGQVKVEERAAPAWVRKIALDHAGPRFSGWQARVAAYGWPQPVLYWLWDWRSESLDGGATLDKVAPAKTKRKEPDRALAWRPIWPAIWRNAGVVGCGVWLLITLLVGVRALRRRGRGWCLACGYDLKHDHAAGCPECGDGRQLVLTSPAQTESVDHP